MSRFEGFGPDVQTWFEGLEANNSREYFTAGRDFFEESTRDQMAALLGELSVKFGGEVKMFRQNRDVRFSPDKSPYQDQHVRRPIWDGDCRPGALRLDLGAGTGRGQRIPRDGARSARSLPRERRR